MMSRPNPDARSRVGGAANAPSNVPSSTASGANASAGRAPSPRSTAQTAPTTARSNQAAGMASAAGGSAGNAAGSHMRVVPGASASGSMQRLSPMDDRESMFLNPEHRTSPLQTATRNKPPARYNPPIAPGAVGDAAAFQALDGYMHSSRPNSPVTNLRASSPSASRQQPSPPATIAARANSPLNMRGRAGSLGEIQRPTPVVSAVRSNTPTGLSGASMGAQGLQPGALKPKPGIPGGVIATSANSIGLGQPSNQSFKAPVSSAANPEEVNRETLIDMFPKVYSDPDLLSCIPDEEIWAAIRSMQEHISRKNSQSASQSSQQQHVLTTNEQPQRVPSPSLGRQAQANSNEPPARSQHDSLNESAVPWDMSDGDYQRLNRQRGSSYDAGRLAPIDPKLMPADHQQPGEETRGARPPSPVTFIANPGGVRENAVKAQPLNPSTNRNDMPNPFPDPSRKANIVGSGSAFSERSHTTGPNSDQLA